MKKILWILGCAVFLQISCTKAAKEESKNEPVKQEASNQPANETKKTDSLVSFEDKTNGLFGFKNEKGDVVIPARFNLVFDPSEEEELIPVVFENKFYRIENNGNLKFESFVFDNAWDYYVEGLARFIANKKIGFHDKKGKTVVNAQFDFASPFSEGYSSVCNGCEIVKDGEHSIIKGGKWGVIDLKGSIVVPIASATQEEAKALLKAKK